MVVESAPTFNLVERLALLVDVALRQCPVVLFKEAVWFPSDGRIPVIGTVLITVWVAVVESASTVVVTAETPRHEQADANAAGEPQADAYAEGIDSWYRTAARPNSPSSSYVLSMPFLRTCATNGVGACVVLWRLSVGTLDVTDTVVVNEL